MKLRTLFFTGLSIMIASAAFTQTVPRDLAQRYLKTGSLLYFPLKNAPFPHPARDNGYTYNGQFFPKARHYDNNTVAVFFPTQLALGETVDFVVYFHGWWNNLDSVLRTFKIVDQFIETKKNAVLVIPQGPRNAPDSFGGQLEEQDGFKKMLDEIADILFHISLTETRQVGNIILAGHSGAYRVMSFILLRGGYTDRIKEVYLFDALYGQTEKYAYWLDHSKGKLIDIYTPEGGTKYESENLMADLTAWKIPFLSVGETALTSEQLRDNRIIFISSQQEHNAVVSQTENFRRFLEASSLKINPNLK
ncbi:MAG: hypothetical protein V1681_06925 [Candidatus Neomarinimicrobiota bacterium]